MRVAVGQEWELPSVGMADPLVLRVVESLDDGNVVVVHTVRRSAPSTILDRSTMWARDVMGAGVLVSGPGALDARRRRERIAHLSDVLLYAARRAGVPSPHRDVHFDGSEIVSLVAEDEKVSRDEARAMLRDALASLGGREITSAYDPWEIGYVVPFVAIERAA